MRMNRGTHGWAWHGQQVWLQLPTKKEIAHEPRHCQIFQSTIKQLGLH